MSAPVLQWATSVASVMLFLWACFVSASMVLRLPTYNQRWRFAFGCFALSLAAMPVGSHPFARLISGLGIAPSIPFLFVLADIVVQDWWGRGWLRESERGACWLWGALAGLALYPSALGLAPFDVYALGWGITPLCVTVGVLAVVLLWLGQRSGIALVLAAAAWQAGLLESANYWDYLVDPVFFVASVAALAARLFRRLEANRAAAAAPVNPGSAA